MDGYWAGRAAKNAEGVREVLYLSLFILGAVVGSFLNVCIYRLPVGESIVFPGSRCLACRRPIAWFDNVPILSYLYLRGRCRNCGSHFSFQYPLTEIISGGLFVLFFVFFGWTAQAIIYLALSLSFWVVALIDLKHRIVPDEISVGGLALGLILSMIFPNLHGQTLWYKGLLFSVIGMVVGGGFLYASAVITEFFLKREAMGGGDIKLLGMIGAFTGWKGGLAVIFLSSVFGSMVGIFIKLSKGESEIAYAPYISLAAFIYLLYGDKLIQWYLGMLGVGV
jgi:leader peptidase (prepilin peptidase) / N-methyltransferase